MIERKRKKETKQKTHAIAFHHCRHRARETLLLDSLEFVPDIRTPRDPRKAIVPTLSQNFGLRTSLGYLDPRHVKRPMNLLRVAVLLRVARILQEFPGLARRAGAQAVGSRRFHAIADNLLFGDLLEVEGGLNSLVIAVHRRRRRVSGRRASRRRAGHFLVFRLYGRAGSCHLLLHLPRPSSVFRR
ncbi:hypothetical protein WN51_09828 [Melipona quadrifasciata]|uniref:Uncharacterized protein n=1 Tax=Melipona quadrifasciata TaxID=166423 RepID=A0A0N0BIB6_9HYME|nr:hypothetical protein WN51_09828 [Melipona quadrifasciata]